VNPDPRPAHLDTARLEDRRDRDLHRRVMLRDRDAFEHLYRRYAGVAYGLALRVTGYPALAQDVVHDAFLALWRAPEAFDPVRGPFRGFLLSLVHHRAVDTVRREERLRRRHARVNPERDEDEDVAEVIVEGSWLAARRARVAKALEGLSAQQRQVLELAYFRGYTQARIAEEVGIPIGTVKTRTLAAMRRLRVLLAGSDGED
jgi:RNA polymerase sigma-70 factor (ECF subfamily)